MTAKKDDDDGVGGGEGGAQAPECECCAVLCNKMRIRLECLVRRDPASWHAQAFSAYAYLREELKRLQSPTSATEPTNIRLNSAAGAERALDEALLAMTDSRRVRCACGRKRTCWSRRPHPWIALKRFYSGSDIEQAWRAIHRAQAILYTIYPSDELVPQAEHVEAVIAELPENASLMKSTTKLISNITVEKGVNPGTTEKGTNPGTMLRGIYERAMDVSDNLQREARGLRNALLVTSLASFFVLMAFGVAHAIDPKIVNLCVKGKVCPTGSPGLDVFAVELAGMLGGLLSIVIPLATGERIKTPFRVFIQQILAKLLGGAASALGGVLLIEAEVIPSIKLETTAAILGYAVVFGFAQQIATGAIDRRADSLAKQTPTAKSV